MITEHQSTEQPIPAGFRIVTDNQDGDVLTTIEGPSSGGVTTYVDNRDGVIVISIDGYEKDTMTGMDMTRNEARRLISDLTEVVEGLEALEAPAVERIARELHALGNRATMDRLGRACDEAGVSPVAVMAAYTALQGADD